MPSKTILSAARTGVPAARTERVVSEFRTFHDDEVSGLAARKSGYSTMVNQYYDLVTDFFEYGWGDSFHFALRYPGEAFMESLRRHEYYLALRLGLPHGSRVLDVGCGVGGPMRAVARFGGYRVVGINNSDYQLERARRYIAKAGMQNQCSVVKGDFMRIPEPDESFDGAFALEATCHAPDRRGVFSEVFRVLKPGSTFTGYDWCLTSKYDPQSSFHRQLKKHIEEGDALPELTTTQVVDEALEHAGFVNIETRDVALDGNTESAWHNALSGGEWSLKALPRRPVGRSLTRVGVWLMETVRIAPRGALEISDVLNRAADALARAGQLGIFTPMYFFSARKPG